MYTKILCLGNEFIEEDSFAKKIGTELGKKGYEIVNIKDSFQLMDELNKENEMIILDVADKLKEVKLLRVDELKENKIMSAHDFDSGFVLKLFENKKIKIIGIPMIGDINLISSQVLKFLGK